MQASVQPRLVLGETVVKDGNLGGNERGDGRREEGEVEIYSMGGKRRVFLWSMYSLIMQLFRLFDLCRRPRIFCCRGQEFAARGPSRSQSIPNYGSHAQE